MSLKLKCNSIPNEKVEKPTFTNKNQTTNTLRPFDPYSANQIATIRNLIGSLWLISNLPYLPYMSRALSTSSSLALFYVCRKENLFQIASLDYLKVWGSNGSVFLKKKMVDASNGQSVLLFVLFLPSTTIRVFLKVNGNAGISKPSMGLPSFSIGWLDRHVRSNQRIRLIP